MVVKATQKRKDKEMTTKKAVDGLNQSKLLNDNWVEVSVASGNAIGHIVGTVVYTVTPKDTLEEIIRQLGQDDKDYKQESNSALRDVISVLYSLSVGGLSW